MRGEGHLGTGAGNLQVNAYSASEDNRAYAIDRDQPVVVARDHNTMVVRDLNPTADTRQVRAEVTSVSDAIVRHRKTVRDILTGVMEGRVTSAAAERRVAEAARALDAFTRRLAEVAPALGRGTGAEAIRDLAQARALDTAEYLDLAGDVLRRWRNRDGGAVVADAPGVDLKPDPLSARTPAEFNQALCEYRAWAGEPSYEEMSRRCGGNPVKSTFSKTLNMTDTLPKMKQVMAVVTGCGGGEDDQRLFASAWRTVQGCKAGEERGGRTRRLRPVPGNRERPA